MKTVIEVLVDQFAYTPQPWEILLSLLHMIVVCQLAFCEILEKVALGKKIFRPLILPGFIGMLVVGYATALAPAALTTLFFWINIMLVMKTPTFIISMSITFLLFGLYQQLRTIYRVQKTFS